MRTILAKIFAIIFIGIFELSHAESVLIHDGPMVSTPDAILYSPLSEQRGEKNITFKYQFLADSQEIEDLPNGTIDQGYSTITAKKAIELASSSLNEKEKMPVVTRLEILKFKVSPSKTIDYYLITMLENGSEVHRVVLMNGTVIKPTMRHIK